MSPRTEKQLEQLKSQRKEQILLAALKLFSVKGYQNTSIDAIAKKAKFSKGLLYHYFDNKEDLLNAVVIYSIKDASEMGDLLLKRAKDKSPNEVFSMMIDLFFGMLAEQKDLWKLTLSLAAQVTAIPSVHTSILEVYKKMIGQLELLFILLDYENPKKEALLLGAILDGISIQYIIFEKDYPIHDVKEMLIKKYTNHESKKQISSICFCSNTSQQLFLCANSQRNYQKS